MNISPLQCNVLRKLNIYIFFPGMTLVTGCLCIISSSVRRKKMRYWQDCARLKLPGPPRGNVQQSKLLLGNIICVWITRRHKSFHTIADLYQCYQISTCTYLKIKIMVSMSFNIVSMTSFLEKASIDIIWHQNSDNRCSPIIFFV